MKNYIQYHNSEAMDYSISDISKSDDFGISTNRSLKDIIGSRVWLIGGEGKPRKYYLCYQFIVDSVFDNGIDSDFKYSIDGVKGKHYNPAIELSGFLWFKSFLKSVQNFSLGLRELPIEYLNKFEKIIDEQTSETKVNVQNRTGAGFGNNETNKFVETAGIDCVFAYYKNKGWRVKSVEQDKCGYDLICNKGKQEHHVEVKGVQGKEIGFIMTKNEYSHAVKDKNYYVFVITNALFKPIIHRFTNIELQEIFIKEVLSYKLVLKPK